MARITIDDKTGHIMSLEYTKYMNEKDLCPSLPSVRDIRTLLLHCSPVTPNQQLKQSFQTFVVLPADEPRQLTSQSQTVLQNELSEGSDRLGVIAKESFKSLILPAVSLGDAVIDPWMQVTRYGRVDFAEVCCTSDSLLSGAVTSVGGRAVQCSHWKGFDLTTKAGTDKFKQDHLERRHRVVWMTPPCTTQPTQQSLSISKFHRIQMKNLVVFVRDDSGTDVVFDESWRCFLRVESTVSQR